MKMQTIIHGLKDPVYLLRRVAYKFYELRRPDEPWLSQDAIRCCAALLNQEMVGLEWGSGRSTAWFARRLKHLHSIEHEKGWHEKIRERLKEFGVSNVSYRYIPLDHDPNLPTVPRYEVPPAYVSVINEFAEEYFDMVIVDGHYRQACILAALPKLKAGGYLLVDNTNWLPLSEWNIPPDWKLVHRSSNVMTETSIWQKPVDSPL